MSTMLNMQDFLNPNQLKPDHLSMYNGQVWFETGENGGRKARHLLAQRRASSAPSASSLDWALRSALHHQSGEQRSNGGQFFPNTLGYMENLASIGQVDANSFNRHLAGAKLTKRHRRRKVVPMNVPTSSKGYLNGAFEGDQLNGASQTSLGSDAELGTGSVMLDSDQELLGFDSTGTPIIATHSKSARKQPLVVDMLEEVDQQQKWAANGQRIVLTDPIRQSNAASAAQRRLSQPKSAELQPKEQPEPTSVDEGQNPKEVPEQPKEGQSEASPDGATGSTSTNVSASSRSSAASELTQVLVESSPGLAKLVANKDQNGGDLMSELSQRLDTRRRQSGESSQVVEESAKPTSRASRLAESGRQETLKSSDDEEANTLLGMKNGELVEKQSIFAITYSGLATDKPPS